MNRVLPAGVQPGVFAATPSCDVVALSALATADDVSGATSPTAASNVTVTSAGSGPPLVVTVVIAFSAVATSAAEAFGAIAPVVEVPSESVKSLLAVPDSVCCSGTAGAS